MNQSSLSQILAEIRMMSSSDKVRSFLGPPSMVIGKLGSASFVANCLVITVSVSVQRLDDLKGWVNGF